MMQAIVNADDFGLCVETNTAIHRAHREGILTSASLMANMPGFDHAVRTVMPSAPGLGVGLHLVLTSGQAVAPPSEIRLLIDERGHFRRGFADLLRLVTGPGADEPLRQIEIEATAQFTRLRRAGVHIDHVNGHQHVHMIPPIWRVIERTARRFGQRPVRLPGAPVPSCFGAAGLSGNVLKRLTLAACATRTRASATSGDGVPVIVRHPDRLAGAMNRPMDVSLLTRVLERLPNGVTEILVHPSLASAAAVAELTPAISRADAEFLASPGRRSEFDALVDGSVLAVVQRLGIDLVSFASIAQQAEYSSAGGAR